MRALPSVNAAVEALGHVMGEVDPIELPEELIDVQISPQMPSRDGVIDVP